MEYDIIASYMDGERYSPELKPHHYAEWAEQLDNAADWCRKQAGIINLPASCTIGENEKN